MNNGSTTDGLLNKQTVVSSLHAILKPFLLRRLKVDVEKELPPKKEYLLYAPLTQQQKDIYEAIVSRQIRQFLVDKKSGNEQQAEEPKAEPIEVDDENKGRVVRKKSRVNYKIEENDSKYIRDLENGKYHDDEPNGVPQKSAAEIGKEWATKQASEFRLQGHRFEAHHGSQICQQYETTQYRNAIEENIEPSIPLRLARR